MAVHSGPILPTQSFRGKIVATFFGEHTGCRKKLDINHFKHEQLHHDPYAARGET